MNKKLAPNQIDSKIPNPLERKKVLIRMGYESWRPGSESIMKAEGLDPNPLQ